MLQLVQPFTYSQVNKHHNIFVFNLQEYKLAQFHCYGRYLTKYLQRGLTLTEVAELDTEAFYKMHLPAGFDDFAFTTMVVGFNNLLGMFLQYPRNTTRNLHDYALISGFIPRRPPTETLAGFSRCPIKIENVGF